MISSPPHGRLLLVSLLGACTPTEADPPAASVDTAQDTSTAPAVSRYVALGDSYTAAPLIAGTSSTTTCCRPRSRLGGRADRRSRSGCERVSAAASGPARASPATRTWSPSGSVARFDVFGNLTGLCPRLRPDLDRQPAPADRLLHRHRHVLRDAGRIAWSRRGRDPEHPEARPEDSIVVVDYPRVVPSSGTCPRLLPLAAGDYRGRPPSARG